ncbi:hypothetical protein BAE44_0018603 [Dichanthelium oligosanthes]|uniref:Uncharacterized protein n=1 Tax=Dichanthelium oligosanthes TaxID=888268 RepID=A0A1E5V5D6_9POAL|nr:hypothetical protein BAE44_0018603 [Dichanthelium oligosanthes]
MDGSEELQEADVLWPWPYTPPPSPEEDEEGSYLPAALPELYEYDAATAVDFSCEPFSGPPTSSNSSLTTSSAPCSDWSSDGFFLSGQSSARSAGVGLDDATEEFLEADVLWPDDADDDEAEDGAAGFWWRCCCRRVEEAASAAAAVASCGEREGSRRPLVSSPIDIPMATRGAAARRRTSPLSAALARRRL